jgi:hypothetical protein
MSGFSSPWMFWVTVFVAGVGPAFLAALVIGVIAFALGRRSANDQESS